jgi:organic radical activating enzyme
LILFLRPRTLIDSREPSLLLVYSHSLIRSFGEVMNTKEVLHAWAGILAGRAPSLSIEITKQCPLRCPGCYAFDAAHLGGTTQLRDLTDFQGDELVARVLSLVDKHKPLHVSLVGGDPMVRYRELDVLLFRLAEYGVYTQIVTSAFRRIPSSWMTLKRLNIVVSIDGLQPEHDARRKPATYDRILNNIKGTRITVHCTITSQIADRPGYLEEFLQFWTSRPEVIKVWFSLFTPQRGATDAEILSPRLRTSVIADLRKLRLKFPRLEMPDSLIKELESPPANPARCIFARTTTTISADLKTAISPCQFGGNPDCEQCGCIASMGLAAVGHHRVVGPITAGDLFFLSDRVGKQWKRLKKPFIRRRELPTPADLFKILEPAPPQENT